MDNAWMQTMNRKKPIILIACISGLLFFTIGLLWFNASGVPAFGPDPNIPGCHNPAGYTISANVTGTISIPKNGTVNVEFTATGGNLILQIVPGARDNNIFSFSVMNVTDNGVGDLDSAPNVIQAIISITAPDTNGNFQILVVARNATVIQGVPPNLAYMTVQFKVGTGASLWDQIVAFFTTYIFNHDQIYLGGAAIICLSIATVFYEYGRSGKGSLASSKYVKVHGWLAFSALVLTTINVIFIISATGATLQNLFTMSVWSLDDVVHFLHIVFGITGYACGIMAMLTGLAGIRTRLWGYLALVFWGFNFVQGVIQWVIPTW
jgi:hypothetical protein